LINLIYFILTSYGLTAILVWSKVFSKIRPNYYFFHCSQCVGFWVGVILCVTNDYTSLFTFDMKFMDIFYLGFLSSGTSYVIDKIFGDEGFNLRIQNENKKSQEENA